jgi:CPA2 family monovalent cation:H+ antiporter-2
METGRGLGGVAMHGLLTEIVLVMVVAVLVALVLRRLSVPPVVGFILAGVAIGPAGLGLVSDRHKIELVAEIGVMLLLFMVGLKISLKDLWRMRATVLGGGGLQYLATSATVALAARLFGIDWPGAVAFGLAIGLSSTALVIWLLEDAGQTGAPVGRTSIGVLLFQDLAVIPVMLGLPLLAGRAESAVEVLLVAGESVAVVAGVIVAARFVVPWLCARIVAARSRELFTLTIVVIALGTAVLLGKFGVSMALGAFIAGMVISESEYVAQIVADVTPMRDVFNSLFFVSIGMLLELDVWLERPFTVAGLVVVVMVGKALIAGIAVLPAVRSLGTAVASGLALAQVGELAVVVMAQAQLLGLGGGGQWKLFLSVAVPTMIATPFVLRVAMPLSRWIEAWRPGPTPELAGTDAESDHVVVVGFGVIGRTVSRALEGLGVPYVVVDTNAAAIKEVTSGGGRSVFGDATRAAVLQAARIGAARAVIVAIPDASATRQVVALSKKLAPDVSILARTRYVLEVEPLEALGADEVIPEEFETSIELTSRVLDLYGASRAMIRQERQALRAAHYGAFRGVGSADAVPSLEDLRDAAALESVKLDAGSPAEGRSLRELAVREMTGATVVAVERDGATRANPSPDLTLASGDRVVVFGVCDQIRAVRRLLAGSEPPDGPVGGEHGS